MAFFWLAGESGVEPDFVVTQVFEKMVAQGGLNRWERLGRTQFARRVSRRDATNQSNPDWRLDANYDGVG
jgi:hypothetical protein